SEEHTSELQSPCNLVCRLLLEKKKSSHRPVLKTSSLFRLLPRAVILLYRQLISEKFFNRFSIFSSPVENRRLITEDGRASHAASRMETRLRSLGGSAITE